MKEKGGALDVPSGGGGHDRNISTKLDLSKAVRHRPMGRHGAPVIHVTWLAPNVPH
jgi:hypothetical protein